MWSLLALLNKPRVPDQGQPQSRENTDVQQQKENYNFTVNLKLFPQTDKPEIILLRYSLQTK